MTFPSTWTTYSDLISGILKSTFAGSSVICVIPYLSLRSIKSIPPRFLDLFTHPESFTVSPIFFAVSDQQVCERSIVSCVIQINISYILIVSFFYSDFMLICKGDSKNYYFIKKNRSKGIFTSVFFSRSALRKCLSLTRKEIRCRVQRVEVLHHSVPSLDSVVGG